MRVVRDPGGSVVSLADGAGPPAKRSVALDDDVFAKTLPQETAQQPTADVASKKQDVHR